MKRILTLILLVAISWALQAQQQMMFTQYMFNTQSFNPAYVGTYDKMSVVGLARQQWVGISGAPSSQTVSLNIPIRKQRIGIGLSLSNDALGPVHELGFSGDFSYIVHLNQSLRLSFGIKASFAVYQTDLAKLSAIDLNDPSLAENLRGDFMPNFGGGMYLYGEKFYVGISTPRLVKNTISVENNASTASGVGEQKIHAFITGGYAFKLSNNVMFRPSVLLKYVYAAPLSFDAAANFLFYDRMWLGASYRIGDALSGIIQYGITDDLWLGYSYGYSLSPLMDYNTGTHEVMLSYDINPNKRKFKSPRYF
ncbi:MAG: hypothetical protein RIS47_476 [Bacteroidota bacterium]